MSNIMTFDIHSTYSLHHQWRSRFIMILLKWFIMIQFSVPERIIINHFRRIHVMDLIAKHLYWWWSSWSNLISNSNLICYDKKGSRKWDNSRRVCCFLNCQKSNAIYFLLMVSYWHEACKAKYFLNSINIRGVGPFTIHPHWTQFLCFIQKVIKVTTNWQRPSLSEGICIMVTIW